MQPAGGDGSADARRAHVAGRCEGVGRPAAQTAFVSFVYLFIFMLRREPVGTAAPAATSAHTLPAWQRLGASRPLPNQAREADLIHLVDPLQSPGLTPRETSGLPSR